MSMSYLSVYMCLCMSVLCLCGRLWLLLLFVVTSRQFLVLIGLDGVFEKNERSRNPVSKIRFSLS
jgi:hypothetical protein